MFCGQNQLLEMQRTCCYCFGMSSLQEGHYGKILYTLKRVEICNNLCSLQVLNA
jgi:hypothetical protein